MTFPRDFTLRKYDGKFFLNSMPSLEAGLYRLYSSALYYYDTRYNKSLSAINDDLKTFTEQNDDLVFI
jgi:hypothetical protein